jgi:hypothetical protein
VYASKVNVQCVLPADRPVRDVEGVEGLVADDVDLLVGDRRVRRSALEGGLVAVEAPLDGPVLGVEGDEAALTPGLAERGHEDAAVVDGGGGQGPDVVAGPLDGTIVGVERQDPSAGPLFGDVDGAVDDGGFAVELAVVDARAVVHRRVDVGRLRQAAGVPGAAPVFRPVVRQGQVAHRREVGLRGRPGPDRFRGGVVGREDPAGGQCTDCSESAAGAFQERTSVLGRHLRGLQHPVG